MIISECEIVDNWAAAVTHGITLISSELYVDATQISFTEAGKAKVLALKLDRVDTGFFNLYLGSSVWLSNNTEVRNLVAQTQSVLSAISQSSVYMS